MSITASPRVQDSVGAALATVRGNWRLLALISLVGAVASTTLQLLDYNFPQLLFPLTLLATIVNAGVYAAFTVVALRAWRPALTLREGIRFWAAMFIVGFFFLIVAVVTILPGSMALIAGPYAKYVPALQAAGQDQERLLSAMATIWQGDPWPLVGFGIFYGLIFFYLSTRLYLAAPATIDRGRILTFETWAWTKKSVSQIALARLMLILPAWILANAIVYLLGRVATSAGSVAAALIVVVLGVFLANMLYGALGAALSAALYRNLGGQNAALPPS